MASDHQRILQLFNAQESKQVLICSEGSTFILVLAVIVYTKTFWSLKTRSLHFDRVEQWGQSAVTLIVWHVSLSITITTCRPAVRRRGNLSIRRVLLCTCVRSTCPLSLTSAPYSSRLTIWMLTVRWGARDGRPWSEHFYRSEWLQGHEILPFVSILIVIVLCLLLL